MMERCPECGKRHVVMWPELHPFRRGELFYCSHGCWEISLQRDLKMIKDIARKRRVKKVNGKLTVDQKARAVEIALAGESPLPYLKEIGMKNPSASWQYIKSVLKNTNPDRWAQLPERLPKNIETPEGGITGPVTINAEDVGAVEVKPEEPKKTERSEINVEQKTLPVCAVRSLVLKDGFYRKNTAGTSMILGGLSMADDHLGLTGENWVKLCEEIPIALDQLGVEL